LGILSGVLSFFEQWVKPFAPKAHLQPPDTVTGFIWFYLRQAKLPFIAVLLLGGATAAIEAALFWFVGHLVDILATVNPAEGWAELLSSHGYTLLGMFLLIAVGRFLVMTLSALVEQQVISPGFNNLVRWQTYLHVARQSISFFQDDFSGRVVSKIGSGSQAVSDLISSLLESVWFFIIYAISTLVLVGSLDWRLAFIVIVWMAIFSALARFFVPRIRKHARAAAESFAGLTGRMVDVFSNIMTLRLFSRDADNDAYMRKGFENTQVTQMQFTRYLTGVRASMSLLSGIMICAMAAMSIDLWLSGSISSGAVAFTLALVLRLNFLLSRLMGQFNNIMRNIGTLQNAAEMIAQPIDLTDASEAQKLQADRPSVTFENVSFHYGNDKLVVDGFNLTIRPGEKVGIVGRSGAGKSTLVNLLLRFYDVTGGKILIDGQDIAQVNQESLRAHIGMVTQDTSLLHRSIRENIAIGRQGATDDEIWAALKRAQADDFVQGLEDQKGRKDLSAHVGERGVKLSGGQRQRIAIARAMLKNAPILVLDEATSALDSEVEAAIQSNLTQLMQGKTVLAIAHRLSTISSLDRLIVMEGGRIIEDGSHDELLLRNGLYSQLWNRQSGGFLAMNDGDEQTV
jgi:ATP-binding cassette subfamily B multidrug efflux pump